MVLAVEATNVWRFRPHPEVWLLVGSVVGLFTYAVKVIGPKAVLPGEPVLTRKQLRLFVVATALLWIAADWPLHDIAEDYLYSFHMVQHLLLTFVVPPLYLMAIPSWLARLVIGPAGSRSYELIRKACRPLFAGLLFNLLSAGSHWSPIVTASVDYAYFHFLLHLVFVTTALMMWMCVCGPIAEWRISLPLQMIYLFLMSVVPTVPGAWMTFATGPLYAVYDHQPRMWNVSVISDQQAAGLIMKLAGGFYLWIIITVLFFRWAKQSGFGRPTPAPRVRPEQPAADAPTVPGPT